jgi:hypothetical protein
MAQQRERVDENAGGPQALGAGGGGTNDVTSGSGNTTGIPDAETAMRAGDAVTRGDTERDRERLFPQAKTHAHPGQQSSGE